MGRKIIFKDSDFDALQIESHSPIDISAIGNMNNIGNITLTADGDNLDKNLIIVDGDFSNSLIDVTSSCTFQSNLTFICKNPIIFDIKEGDTVVFLGDFIATKGVKFLAPATVVSGNSVQLKQLNLVVAYKEDNSKPLNILGDFSLCNVFVETSSNLNLDGEIGNVVVESEVNGVTLNLSPESTVEDMKVYSNIVVTGDAESIENLKNNTTEGLDKIIVSDVTFIMNTTNGQGVVPLNLSGTGIYIVSCSVIKNEDEVQIGTPITIEIKE